jgi:hypothetical protein
MIVSTRSSSQSTRKRRRVQCLDMCISSPPRRSRRESGNREHVSHHKIRYAFSARRKGGTGTTKGRGTYFTIVRIRSSSSGRTV